MTNIIKTIRRVCLRNIFFPALIITLLVLLLLNIPFLEIFHPSDVNNIYKVKSTDSYVNVTTDTLYYSGYNLTTGTGKSYGYYYALEDEHCVFVLLPVSQKPESVLKNYTFSGKLIKPDKSYNQMLTSFAKDLNWNEKSLSHISESFIISTADYHPIFYMILLWLLLIIILVYFKKLISSLIGFIKPDYYPVCTFLGKKVQRELIDEAQEELLSENYIQINSMYITENYFVDLSKSQVSVIPLKDIVWCYRLGTIPLIPKFHKPKYSLYFTIISGAVIIVRHKTSDEALELINAIHATEYDIIIGHSDSKRKLAKRIIRQFKKQL